MATEAMSDLQLFEGYECRDPELAITGTCAISGLELTTLGTRVRVIIEVLDDEDRVIRKLPRLQGRVSKRAWARKEDKDSGAEYAVPKTTLTVSGA